MLLTVRHVLSCDRCGAQYESDSESKTETKADATSAGWLCKRSADICPECQEYEDPPEDLVAVSFARDAEKTVGEIGAWWLTEMKRRTPEQLEAFAEVFIDYLGAMQRAAETEHERAWLRLRKMRWKRVLRWMKRLQAYEETEVREHLWLTFRRLRTVIEEKPPELAPSELFDEWMRTA